MRRLGDVNLLTLERRRREGRSEKGVKRKLGPRKGEDIPSMIFKSPDNEIPFFFSSSLC
jgi:hypothetical protein